MKKSAFLFSLLAILFCISTTFATIESGADHWGVWLDAWESITCVAFYGFDGLVFTQNPSITYVVEQSDWHSSIANGGSLLYIYGPEGSAYNDSPFNNVYWFDLYMHYQWDTEHPDYDENNPVKIDVAMFDGDTLLDSWSYQGISGDGNSWVYSDDQLDTEAVYTNPVPEPAMICLLGFGAVLVRRQRR